MLVAGVGGGGGRKGHAVFFMCMLFCHEDHTYIFDVENQKEAFVSYT